jgi:hypothetical protein
MLSTNEHLAAVPHLPIKNDTTSMNNAPSVISHLSDGKDVRIRPHDGLPTIFYEFGYVSGQSQLRGLGQPKTCVTHQFPTIVLRDVHLSPIYLYPSFFNKPPWCDPSQFSSFEMPPRKSKPVARWSMYPALHEDVSVLLAEEDLVFDFHGNDDDDNCVQEYDTNVMGRFICRNRTCRSGGWSSMVIPITIRMYSGARYNARVYHQHCRNCNSLSKPRLSDSYAERVAYRLKKWSGIEMEPPQYSGGSKGPHEEDLCEGCQNGHCIQSKPGYND